MSLGPYSCKTTRVSLHMVANSVHAKTRDNVHSGVRCSPDDRTEGVLLRRVPRTGDQYESRGDGALKPTLERAQNHEMSEVLREGDAQDDNTPKNHDDGQKLARVRFLHDPITGKLARHVGQVEDGAQPVVLVANEACVLADSEDCLRTERGFVGLLGAVTEPHQRQ